MPTNDDLGVRTAEAVERLGVQGLGLDDGRGWVYRNAPTLSRDQSYSILLRNPASNDTNLYVARAITSTAGLEGQITQNVTVDSAGTDVEFLATDIRDPRLTDDPADVQRDPTTSGGTGQLPIEIPSGSARTSGGGGLVPASFRMQPGTNLLYDVTSGGDNNEVVVDFTLTEVDPDA